jgi:hypothetical protein
VSARVRSALLFLGGFFGAGYEVVIDHIERPSVLILLGGMMGLPAFIGRKPGSDPTSPEDKT